MWNLSFGFFGVQIAYALQSANISRIFATLGADPHQLSFFWILPPLMGMIVQPLIGKWSDRTWCRLGRRKPYLLAGAIVAVLTLITAGISEDLPPVALVAVALVCIGVVGLGFVEANEDEELRRARQDASNRHYAKSWIAILIPVIYCLLDALGTFADSRVLEVLDEDSANVAYELTFLMMGVLCAIYVLGIKKQKLIARQEAPKYTGALFETVGQFFYIYALADTEHVAFAAPIISSYCVASVLWSRIFLKEKLSWKHYCAIVTVIAGVIILGILDL